MITTAVKQPRYLKPHKGRLVLEDLYKPRQIVLTVTVYPHKRRGLCVRIAGKHIPVKRDAAGYWRIDWTAVPVQHQIDLCATAAVEYSTKPVNLPHKS